MKYVFLIPLCTIAFICTIAVFFACTVQQTSFKSNQVNTDSSSQEVQSLFGHAAYVVSVR